MKPYRVKIRLASNRVTNTKIWADSVTTAREMAETLGFRIINEPKLIEENPVGSID